MVCKPLVADGVFYKPLVACVDRRSQALGGRWSHLQAFRGIRGSSCTCLWWHAWIVVCKPLVAYVDRRSQAFGGIWSRLQAFGGLHGSPFATLLWQMKSFTSLWWHMWIIVHKPLVADGVIYKPLVAYGDRRVQGFWWHTLIVKCKPLVACVDCR